MSAAAPVTPRRAWVEQVMGLPVSIHVRGGDVDGSAVAAAVAAVFAELRWVDAVFSTWKPDSEVSRLARGEVDLSGCHPAVAEVVALCDEARRRTDGWFDALLPHPGGGTRFDPTGLVKGWGVERACTHLADLADHSWCVNAGGDVLVRTAPDDPDPWIVGVEDPADLDRLLCAIPVRRGAVATSGPARRGPHIVDPHTGLAAGGLWSVSVLGPSLLWADVDATAAVAMGAGALTWLRDVSGHEALVVPVEGAAGATPGLLAALA